MGLARAIRYGLLAWLGSMYSKQIFGFFSNYYPPILLDVDWAERDWRGAALYWT